MRGKNRAEKRTNTPAVRKWWSRKNPIQRKRIIRIALASALALSAGELGRRVMHLVREPIPREAIILTQQKTQHVKVSHFNEVPETGYYCSKYFRHSTYTRFGCVYAREPNSWEMPKRNPTVWEYTKGNEHEYRSKLKPGYAVCIFLPGSNFRYDGERKEREFTHIADFIGFNPQGNAIVEHRVGKNDRLETLDGFLKKYNGRVMRILRPDPKQKENAAYYAWLRINYP
ncbi:MAG: hypothetical protein V1776_02450 [Candidatus Diapherotrites archaeon]